LNVDLLTLIALDFLVMEVSDSLLGASGTVGAVAVSVEANESEGLLNTFLVGLGHQEDGLDVTVLGEASSDLLLFPREREVLDVDFVADLADVCRLLLLILLKMHHVLILYELHRLLEALLCLKTHEAIVIGDGSLLQVFVNGV
jgi:hypothetical protein